MRYLALLDFSISKVRIIKLDDMDLDLLASLEEITDFIRKVEDKYDFKESNCSWMIMDNLKLEII